MATYVDDMYRYEMGQFKARGGRVFKMSHMIADTHEELVEMADRIGVSRRWLQKPGKKGEHFDISMSKRALAVKEGAIEVSMRELARRWDERDVDAYFGRAARNSVAERGPSWIPDPTDTPHLVVDEEQLHG